MALSATLSLMAVLAVKCLADGEIHLKYLGGDFIAVPVGDAYKVFSAAVEGTPKNGTTFSFRIQSVDATYGAWEY
ncbi:hypothetical protein E4T39_00083 [Aureobasidium subglaciale]|nr:hypothetical protein E4T39_00083 [Aureobasidium subglaciale]